MMNPYGILGVIGLMGVMFVGGLTTGKRLESSHWLKEKIEMQAASAEILQKANDENRKIVLENNAKTREAADRYESALTSLENRYATDLAGLRAAGGLRINRDAICGNGPTTSEASSTVLPDAPSSASIELPERIERNLLALAKRADSLAEQLRALQGWIVLNGFYGREVLPPPAH